MSWSARPIRNAKSCWCNGNVRNCQAKGAEFESPRVTDKTYLILLKRHAKTSTLSLTLILSLSRKELKKYLNGT